MGSTRLVDALLPLLILAAIGAGAMGWMNGSAAAFGERAPALPSTPVAEAPQAVLSAAKPVRLAEAAPPPPAPAPAPAPVAPVLPPQEMSSAETREEARSADERPRETRQAARKRKAAAEAASKRKKALAERKAPRPKVKYRYSENMRLFCEKAGAATPECKTFRRNTAKRRRA
jgi:predicted membrane-bound mannosyltransferase